MAAVSGAAAPAFMEALGAPDGVRIQGPVDDAWRIIAPDHDGLSAALAAVARPPGRLRIAVDPLRLYRAGASSGRRAAGPPTR